MRAWPALDVCFPASGHATADCQEMLQVALLDFAVSAIDDNATDRWRLYFQLSDERDRAVGSLSARFAEWAFVPVEVPDENWAARSQAALHAVQVGHIVVAPPWDLVIRIVPSMGFGTGHHATTRLCLAALQALTLRGTSTLDVGTGSGVLAIAASLLGAGPVVAIDDDPDAVQSALENVALNPAAQVEVRAADLRDTRAASYALVIANLTGALLIQQAERLHDLATPDGTLVLSGLMQRESAAVLEAFTSRGARVVSYAEEEEWVCVTLHKSPSS